MPSRPVLPAAPAAAAPEGPAEAYERACAEPGVEQGSGWVLVCSTWRRNLPNWHTDQGGAVDVWRCKLAAYILLEAWQQFEEPP